MASIHNSGGEERHRGKSAKSGGQQSDGATQQQWSSTDPSMRKVAPDMSNIHHYPPLQWMNKSGNRYV